MRLRGRPHRLREGAGEALGRALLPLQQHHGPAPLRLAEGQAGQRRQGAADDGKILQDAPRASGPGGRGRTGSVVTTAPRSPVSTRAARAADRPEST
ncbi:MULTISPECIES: hypothetical protein [unclassified Methylobacterium]|uniref:hypothetical protein n=1 Tax=unclassified Methylobacterium TaxID=2615210 RepID=UPI00037AC5F9|nr:MULTISPECIES: hypothetical protein [Methylobacterium]WFT80698.1 hypothetical protein QA634_01975 [Methylobacterium nodulans]